jgi:ABC-type uncharacterized transport system permease subunit
VSLTDRQCFLLAVMTYGLSAVYSVFLWRKGFRRDNRVNYALLLAGAALHTVAMLKRGFSFERCPVNNLYEVTAFVSWTIVAAYLVIGVVSRLRFLGAFASPVLFAMGVFALMPKLDPPHGPKPDFSGGALSLHAALILLAYGAFGLSFIAALMYLSQEHDLKFHKARALFSLLPPIQRLEAVIGRLLIGGFALLTAGLFIGAMWLKPPPGTSFFGDWKVMWSALVWVLYLALLVTHWRNVQGGRRFAWGAVGGFAFILLTFWGSNLLSNIHHPIP